MDRTEVLQILLKAKQGHLEWRSHAEQLIKGMALSDAKVPADDRCCEFGQWYSGPAKSCLGFLEAHKVMHAVYRQIHDLAVQNNLKEAQGRLLELAQASDALLDALELLEQEVLTSPECPE